MKPNQFLTKLGSKFLGSLGNPRFYKSRKLLSNSHQKLYEIYKKIIIKKKKPKNGSFQNQEPDNTGNVVYVRSGIWTLNRLHGNPATGDSGQTNEAAMAQKNTTASNSSEPKRWRELGLGLAMAEYGWCSEEHREREFDIAVVMTAATT